MMRPLQGIVFPPSDKSGLTRPLGHNCLVTELHPDWDPGSSSTCNVVSSPRTRHFVICHVRNKKEIQFKLPFSRSSRLTLHFQLSASTLHLPLTEAKVHFAALLREVCWFSSPTVFSLCSPIRVELPTSLHCTV